MCRLFALTSTPCRVKATFWLLEAPDSLAAQSRGEPDGTGLGVFDTGGTPAVFKQPLAAYEDQAFAHEAREVESTVFLGHVRYATTGDRDVRNTHPFAAAGRLFAHNGVIEDLDRLDAQLGPYRELVHGDTDSERFFALVTQQIDAHGGDVDAGIRQAITWVAAELPLYSLNMIMATATDLWALRYPETHRLYVLERAAGGPHGARHLDHASHAGRIRVRCGDLAEMTAVVVASERMDDNPYWRSLQPGELLHIGPELTVESHTVLTVEPTHRLTLADLHPQAAAAQQIT